MSMSQPSSVIRSHFFSPLRRAIVSPPFPLFRILYHFTATGKRFYMDADHAAGNDERYWIQGQGFASIFFISIVLPVLIFVS